MAHNGKIKNTAALTHIHWTVTWLQSQNQNRNFADELFRCMHFFETA